MKTWWSIAALIAEEEERAGKERRYSELKEGDTRARRQSAA